MIGNKIILGCIVLLCFCACGKRNSLSGQEARECLKKLDSALNKTEEYGEIMQTKLSNLKQKAAQTHNPEACYFYNKLIYENYSFFISDSAFCYIDRNYQLGLQHRKSEWIAESYLAKAKIYSATGLLDEASDMLQKASVLPMSHELKLDYLVQQIYYWSQRAIYYRIPLSEEVYMYADSLMNQASDSTSPYHLWGRFWYEKKDEMKAETCRLIKEELKTLDKEDPWYGNFCFAVGILSDALDMKEEALKYFVEGLCIDISHVNRNIPALSIVAQTASDMGELIYANRFMKAYMAMRDDYTDRIRSLSMSSPPMRIYDSTVQQLEKDVSRRNLFIGCLAGMLFVLLLFSVFIYILLKKQVKLRRKLSESNQKLEENLQRLMEYQTELQTVYDSLNEKSKQLEKTHFSLLEANFLKEEYIGNLFAVCSDYLGKMNDLKKSIARKIKAKQFEDLLKMAASGDNQMETEMKELNKHFDTIFLSIFPDFVEEFNALLKPDEHITVRKGEKLNTDLRIYALVRLGINNSVKIAKILGVSPQTVYNARMKMRTRVTESEEELASRVRQLCVNEHNQAYYQEETTD